MIAGLCFLVATAALLGWLIPANWWTALVSMGCASSALLYLLYVGLNAIIPLVIDAILLLGIFGWHWKVAALR